MLRILDDHRIGGKTENHSGSQRGSTGWGSVEPWASEIGGREKKSLMNRAPVADNGIT